MKMGHCRGCRTPLRADTIRCVTCGTWLPAMTAAPRWQVLVGIFAVVAAVGIVANRPPDPVAPNDAPAVRSEANIASDVGFHCREWVKQRLKAPATAKFPREGREAGRLIGGDSTQWLARGVVDAQNSFGALIRNRYECEARVTGAPGEERIASVRVTIE